MSGKIIAYEGLFSFGFGPLRRSLKKNFPGLKFESRPWTDNTPTTKDDILIGHSFGGGKAFDMAKKYGCEIVFTLDARFPKASRNDNLNTKKEFKCFNFYQCGGFRGYHILNAVNSPNHDRKLFHHMRLPKDKTFISTLRKYLGEFRGY